MGAAAVFETAAETPPTAAIVSGCVLGARSPMFASARAGSEAIDGPSLKCVGVTYSGSPPRRAKEKRTVSMIDRMERAEEAAEPCKFCNVDCRAIAASLSRLHRIARRLEQPSEDAIDGLQRRRRPLVDGATESEAVTAANGERESLATYRHAQNLAISGSHCDDCER